MSRTEVTQGPRMRIRLPPEIEQTVNYLLARRDAVGNKRRKGEAALDDWSWAHVASGAGLALTGVSWAWAAVLLVGFEAFEGALRRFQDGSGEGLFEYESWPNVVADVLTGMAGFAAAKMFMAKPFARAALTTLLPLLGKR